MKSGTSTRTLEQKSCLMKAGSQIAFLPFVDTVGNCKAHCDSKAACQSFNYDQATFGCRLYSDLPTSIEQNLHSTCGTMCKDNNEGLARAMHMKGLQSVAKCAEASSYCSQDDVQLNCPVSCNSCSIDI